MIERQPSNPQQSSLPSVERSLLRTENRPAQLPRPLRVLSDEEARWHQLLGRLEKRVEEGSLTAAQHRAFRAIWEPIRERVRRPSVTVSNERLLHLGWGYEDLPCVLTVEIQADGRCEWFFRNRRTGVTDGTIDEPHDGLPGQAIELLLRNFAPIPRG